MKTIDEISYDIAIEYHRLIEKTGENPSYLIVNHIFIDELFYLLVGINIGLDKDKLKTYKYMGMEVKRSFDLKKDEFILSFNKYQL